MATGSCPCRNSCDKCDTFPVGCTRCKPCVVIKQPSRFNVAAQFGPLKDCKACKGKCGGKSHCKVKRGCEKSLERFGYTKNANILDRGMKDRVNKSYKSLTVCDNLTHLHPELHHAFSITPAEDEPEAVQQAYEDHFHAIALGAYSAEAPGTALMFGSVIRRGALELGDDYLTRTACKGGMFEIKTTFHGVVSRDTAAVSDIAVPIIVSLIKNYEDETQETLLTTIDTGFIRAGETVTEASYSLKLTRSTALCKGDTLTLLIAQAVDPADGGSYTFIGTPGKALSQFQGLRVF